MRWCPGCPYSEGQSSHRPFTSVLNRSFLSSRSNFNVSSLTVANPESAFSCGDPEMHCFMFPSCIRNASVYETRCLQSLTHDKFLCMPPTVSAKNMSHSCCSG